MELWIRSQDGKRLTKVEDIYMVEDENNFTSYIGNSMVGHLGEYKKVGRALEVLDEIQELLNPKSILKFNFLLKKEEIEIIKQATENKYVICSNDQDIKLPNSIVYEMPKE